MPARATPPVAKSFFVEIAVGASSGSELFCDLGQSLRTEIVIAESGDAAVAFLESKYVANSIRALVAVEEEYDLLAHELSALGLAQIVRIDEQRVIKSSALAADFFLPMLQRKPDDFDRRVLQH